MCPLLIHGYLILAGHILVIASSMSLAQYESDFLQGYGILSSKYTEEAPLPYNEMSSEELGGVGSFDTTCLLNSNVNISFDLYVLASGNIEIIHRVLIACPMEGCVISFNLSGNIKVGENFAIIVGSVIFSAANMTMGSNSVIKTIAMGGAPHSQTSGTPVGYEGAGGGHGGRGAISQSPWYVLITPFSGIQCEEHASLE